MKILKSLIVLFMFLLAGCGVTKPPSPQVIVRDSIIFRDRIVHDTAKFEVPIYIEKNVTRDTASYLENPFAKSDAIVSEGFLIHSLETKQQTIYIPVEVPVTDTLYVHDGTQIIEKEVEKELTWWQTFQIKSFWWLIGGLALSLLWIFRKPLLALIKTIL